MNYNQVQKLIPFVDENFIIFPLAITEGVYIPFYNFWQSLSTKEDVKLFLEKSKDILENTGYNISFQYEEDVHIYNHADIERNSTIVDFQIYPIFETDDDNDGNVFVNVDPKSFDADAIDLLIKIISK